MNKKRIACLLLAAGKSSRMQGRNKLLLKINGEALVRRSARQVMKVDFSEVVFVTGHDSASVGKELEDFSVKKVFNPDFAKGMHSSIRRGILELDPHCEAFFVCLSDQPELNPHVLNKLKDQFSLHPHDSILYPVFEGERGHPVLISAKYREEILNEPDGDYGCSYLFKRYPEKLVPVEIGLASVLMDIDTPQDYAAFEAIHGV